MEYRQRIIAVKKTEVKEFLVRPGEVAPWLTKLSRGWETVFAYGRPERFIPRER